MPIHLNDYEGFPDFPLEVDDEFITASGAFPQPTGRLSVMTGFVYLLRLFRIMQESIVRHRRHKQSSVFTVGEAELGLAWVEQAARQIEEIIRSLPPPLAGVPGFHYRDEDEAAVFGMQRANLLITALSLQFVLFEYKLELSPDNPEIIREREAAGRRGIDTLRG